MDVLTAYCGLACGTCPIRLATLEPDPIARTAAREEIARKLREVYGMPAATAEMVECEGCRVGGRLFPGCRDCAVRPCAIAHGVESCAFCPDFGCATLEAHYTHDPESRALLEALRAVH